MLLLSSILLLSMLMSFLVAVELLLILITIMMLLLLLLLKVERWATKVRRIIRIFYQSENWICLFCPRWLISSIFIVFYLLHFWLIIALFNCFWCAWVYFYIFVLFIFFKGFHLLMASVFKWTHLAQELTNMFVLNQVLLFKCMK